MHARYGTGRRECSGEKSRRYAAMQADAIFNLGTLTAEPGYRGALKKRLVYRITSKYLNDKLIYGNRSQDLITVPCLLSPSHTNRISISFLHLLSGTETDRIPY